MGKGRINYIDAIESVENYSKHLMTPLDLAETIDVSREAVYKWIHRDELPATQVGGNMYVMHTEDVIEFLRTRFKTSGAGRSTINLSPEATKTFDYAYKRFARGRETYGDFIQRLCRVYIATGGD